MVFKFLRCNKKMISGIVLSIFIMAVGLCVAGMGTHLYQLVWRVPATIGYGGKTYLATLGHLSVSFFCGPYIMLNMGLNRPGEEKRSYFTVLFASFIAFSWSFITGLIIVGFYIGFFG